MQRNTMLPRYKMSTQWIISKVAHIFAHCWFMAFSSKTSIQCLKMKLSKCTSLCVNITRMMSIVCFFNPSVWSVRNWKCNKMFQKHLDIESKCLLKLDEIMLMVRLYTDYFALYYSFRCCFRFFKIIKINKLMLNLF